MGATLVVIPWLMFVLLAFISLLIFFAWRIDIALALTLATLALGVCGDLDEEGTITITKIMVFLVATIYIFQALARKDYRLIAILSRDSPTLFLWFFLLWATASMLWSTSWGGSLVAVLRVVSLAGMYIIILAIVQNRTHLRLVIAFAIIACALVTVGGVYEMVTHRSVQQFFGKSRAITVATTTGEKLSSRNYGQLEQSTTAYIIAATQGTWARVLATFGSENEYAAYLLGILGPAIAFWFLARRRLYKLLLSVFIFLVLVNLIGTGSRGGLLSFLTLCFVWLLCARLPLKWPIVAMLIPACGAALFLLPQVFEQFRSGFTMEAVTTDPRWYLYQMELAMWRDHPLTGGGFGTFYLSYGKYHIPGSPFWPLTGHNVPLQMLAEIGLPGSLLWLAVCGSIAYALIWAIRLSRDRFSWFLSVGLLSSVCSYLLNMLMENSLGQSHFWAILGLSVAWVAVQRDELAGMPQPKHAGQMFQGNGSYMLEGM